MLIQTHSPLNRAPAESLRIPEPLSIPRSALSNLNRIFKGAEGLHLIDNPLPGEVQDTVSILGAGFAAFNVGAELYDRDWMGALEDTASSSTSLLGGIKLLTDNESVADGFGIAGAVLNCGLAVQDISEMKYFDAGIKIATATGLSLTSLGSGIAESVGLTVLGVSGLVDLANDQVQKFRSDTP